MNLNEIKKLLYKQKPIAMRNSNTSGNECDIYVYACQIKVDNPIKPNQTVFFEVPKSEMGENIFDEKVEAQLLIRWIVTE